MDQKRLTQHAEQQADCSRDEFPCSQDINRTNLHGTPLQRFQLIVSGIECTNDEGGQKQKETWKGKKPFKNHVNKIGDDGVVVIEGTILI